VTSVTKNTTDQTTTNEKWKFLGDSPDPTRIRCMSKRQDSSLTMWRVVLVQVDTAVAR